MNFNCPTAQLHLLLHICNQLYVLGTHATTTTDNVSPSCTPGLGMCQIRFWCYDALCIILSCKQTAVQLGCYSCDLADFVYVHSLIHLHTWSMD